jgi:4-hydroxy 2-oxovalerate aldolase
MNIKLVDCTFRDGGYYNNWDFSLELINQYLVAMRRNDVEYVELGFRSFETSGFKGACAYTTDNFLSSLSIPQGICIGVMVNAAELLKYPAGPSAAIDKLFKNAKDSPVNLVRIACHIFEFNLMLPVCLKLKEMGYTVGINLMQVADRSHSDLEEIGKSAAEFSPDTLYFADSLGGLDPDQVKSIISALRKYWSGPIGIHAHDNMGRAVQNTLSAIHSGATWIDSTVKGMGRGPGNAQTEILLIELAARFNKKIDLIPLMNLISDHFESMHFKYKWGMNPYYYLSGLYGIHPTYIQEMLGDTRYNSVQIIETISHLRTIGAKKFDESNLVGGLENSNTICQGSWTPSNQIRGRQVLILGAGPSIYKHKTGLERLAKDKNLFVIALNSQSNITQDLINLHAVCHPFRLIADRDLYKKISGPIVMPTHQTTSEVIGCNPSIKFLNFGLVIKNKVFEFNKNSATIPTLLAAAYALGVATSGKASRILLAGFDGFLESDPRRQEMQGVFDIYQGNKESVPILSITPTNFNIPTSSLYALE